MITRIPITKARVNLGSIIKRVHLNNERFIIEKDGYPVAMISDIDEFEDFLELNDHKMKKQIREGFKEFKTGKTEPAKKLLAELSKSKK